MKAKTIQKLKELNALLVRVFEFSDDFSDQELNQPEDDSKWSMMQVLEHLKMTEQLSFNYIYKIANSDRELATAGLKAKYNSWMLQKVMLSPAKINAPKIEGLSPAPGPYSLKATKDDYLCLRKKYYDFFNGLDPAYFEKMIWKHPVFGKLSLYQMICFYEAHTKRHIKQLKRISKNLKTMSA